MTKHQLAKNIFLFSAASIAIVSLVFSHKLSRELLSEEQTKMEVWAEAMGSLIAADEHTDLNLVLSIINSNNTIPVIVVDIKGNVLAHRNLHPVPAGTDSLEILQDAVRSIKEHKTRMRMGVYSSNDSLSDVKEYIDVFYEDSLMLKKLSIYPYVQLFVVGIFMVIGFYALVASKKAEQNRIWVGLSRETAHQLGTPISSLMAWSEVLASSYPHDPLLPEMNKDVQRLQLIAERFSKIGSAPEFEIHDLCEVVSRVVEYIDRRTSQKVNITLDCPPYQLPANINAPLFEWVVENLCKNAVDAMHGEGFLNIKLEAKNYGTRIEITDNGKGIAKKYFKSVFNPGFTTKKRGWGLGLSLAKRIVEEYHKGKIFIGNSELGKGTTFVIEIGRHCMDKKQKGEFYNKSF